MSHPIRKPDAPPWRLRDADRTLRAFLTAFLVVVTCGYAIGLVFVDHTSSGSPSGLAAEYRGTEQDGGAAEMKFEKGAREMYTFLHNHVFSLSLLFFSVGAVFYFSSTGPGWWKMFLIVEPFLAVVTTFGGIWLLRFVSPGFVWLVIPSGISMGICYLIMVVLILRELWWRR